MTGDYDRAFRVRSSVASRSPTSRLLRASAGDACTFGNVELLRGNLDADDAHHQALIDDPVVTTVPWLQAMALVGKSAVARRRERYHEAEHRARPGVVDAADSSRATHALARAGGAGYLADQVGDYDAALERQRMALETTVTLGTPRGRWRSRRGYVPVHWRSTRKAPTWSWQLNCWVVPIACVATAAGRCRLASGSTSTGPNAALIEAMGEEAYREGVRRRLAPATQTSW